ncbi:hypothetical protein B7O87_12445 [Cylindrospermopsis raciborskii CENA303]|uniref:Phosphohydrolase n=1 Tax=Cylindrospermopsis raciborskii CENA303 TaxID=1170769 RepID=A0A1X4G4V5_9CYAN|nr:HD domain-containing protein [Cylindrospermopsis raciborskii]EFA72042.1 hypothetical protein CRD_02563 [Raphidiopsis brookii D9]OSO89480.1 hypothetical protein B7O87_12445 [Cylindrospermopsis raciborskii CENA303]
MLKKALMIATAAHAGQKDKAGAPYIGHVLRVVDNVRDGDAKIVAALHDVVEDCSEWDFNRLAAEGFNGAVIDAVKAITKLPDDDYHTYLARVKSNDLARVVKLADLTDNMLPDRIPNPGPKDLRRLEKYAHAKVFLEH